MVARMLDHRNIDVALETTYRATSTEYRNLEIIHTGPIDEYFESNLGPLPYRSLRLETRVEACERVLPAATVNYPDDRAYTRETEVKQITGQIHDKTAILREFPIAHVPGETEPYYPIPNEQNHARFAAYRKAAAGLPVRFCGRLGEYRYYNMDQAVAAALATFEQITRARA